MPPSRRISIRPSTASVTAGSARIDAGVVSRLLPPWLETEMASAPMSTAWRAWSGWVTPLISSGPSHC
jgi:hypothetical protein